MTFPLLLLALLSLAVAAAHLAVCSNRLRAMSPIPGEARLWFRPFVYAPLIAVAGLAVYALAPEGESVRYGLGAAYVVAGIWLAVLFGQQRYLYAELASGRERLVLIRYTVAMLASAELAILCLLYGPITNTPAVTMNLIALVFGTVTINLIVASLHHRAAIQESEQTPP